MKHTFIYSLLVVLVVFLSSCAEPKTKEKYIDEFEKFVERVKQNHENYNKNDWKWADEQFRKYNSKYYLKFKGKYNLEDQLKIKSFIVEYYSLKNKEDLGALIQDLIKEDVDDVKGKLEDYFENNAEKDLEKLMDGATEIGDSALKVLDEIIEKIENQF